MVTYYALNLLLPYHITALVRCLYALYYLKRMLNWIYVVYIVYAIDCLANNNGVFSRFFHIISLLSHGSVLCFIWGRTDVKSNMYNIVYEIDYPANTNGFFSGLLPHHITTLGTLFFILVRMLSEYVFNGLFSGLLIEK